MKAREYAGPVGVLAAGVIGMSLLCSVSAMAMGDLRNFLPIITIQPLNIVDLAVSNLETAAALTEQVVTVFVPTQTLVPTATLSMTPLPSDTSTPRHFVTVTPTRTRRPRPSNTPIVVPSKTSTHIPPTRTDIPITPTDTPEPPTWTPEPPTLTPEPPTLTPEPPTPTSEPPTATDVPTEPNTPIPILDPSNTPAP